MKKQINITMEGGIIQDISGLPKETEVVVRDYDAEMYDIDELKEDEEGNNYKEIIFTN